MTQIKKITGPFLPPQSGKAKELVVFLHGYGSNGDDLLSIGEIWAEHLPDAAFVSPNAPDICEAYPMGYQWFSIREIDDKALAREKQLEVVVPSLGAFLDEQLAQWNVPEEKLAVVGFSQGAMMAMYTMPRRKKPCAAVIGYSGLLMDPEGLKAKDIVKPAILAIHGSADDVVPARYLEGVQTGFSVAGFDVETVLRPGLEHSIDQFGMKRGLEFIRKQFEK